MFGPCVAPFPEGKVSPVTNGLEQESSPEGPQQSQGKDGRFNGVVTAFRRGPYFLYTKYQEYLV